MIVKHEISNYPRGKYNIANYIIIVYTNMTNGGGLVAGELRPGGGNVGDCLHSAALSFLSQSHLSPPHRAR